MKCIKCNEIDLHMMEKREKEREEGKKKSEEYLSEGSIEGLPLLAEDPGHISKGGGWILLLDIGSLFLGVVHEG
jgi:hypothetical protein